jgi:NAD(P)H-hydrate epimerase
MYVLTPDEMRALDKEAIERLGIPGMVLMENAGRTIFEVTADLVDLETSSVVVVAGPGNNGGDGFVVARYMRDRADDLSVFLIGSGKNLKGDARTNYGIVRKMGIEVVEIHEGTEELDIALRTADLVIDAMFGTGFKGKLDGSFREAAALINESPGVVLAVDIPSGISGATGEVKGECVMADVTVTMAFPKVGHCLYPGKVFVGDLVVADIGIPPSIAEGKAHTRWISEDLAAVLIPPRIGPEHKGSFGRVLTLAGSRGYTGAAALASTAALRSGAGLSYLALPESLNPIAETKVTEVITLPVSEQDGVISREAAKEVLRLGLEFDAVSAGPGLTRSESVKGAVLDLLEGYDGPVVLDADAVVVIKDDLDRLKGRAGETVLTPHPGEFGAVLGLSAREVSENRLEMARDFAEKYGVVLVLKGAPTVIATKEGECWINTTGNPGMASGGTGDVLTGLIAGFLGQGLDGEAASVLGVHLHGLSGDLAAIELTEPCLMAEDLLDFLPDAFLCLTETEEEEEEEE